MSGWGTTAFSNLEYFAYLFNNGMIFVGDSGPQIKHSTLGNNISISERVSPTTSI
jgi:hypothetical protein